MQSCPKEPERATEASRGDNMAVEVYRVLQNNFKRKSRSCGKMVFKSGLRKLEGKMTEQSCAQWRETELEPWQQRQVQEHSPGGRSDMSLLSRACSVVWEAWRLWDCAGSALDCVVQVHNYCGSEQQEIQDEERFIFWIKPSWKTSVVHAAARSHAGDLGLCYSQRSCWCPWSDCIWKEATVRSVVCAVARDHVEVRVLCPAGGLVGVCAPCCFWLWARKFLLQRYEWLQT